MARKTYHMRISDKKEEKVKEEKENKYKGISKELEYSIISIVLALLVGIVSVYAICKSEIDLDYTQKVGTLDIKYKSSVSNLELIDAYPISDEIGLKKKPFIFTISNTGDFDVYYKIRLVDNYLSMVDDRCEGKNLSKSKIKVSVNDKQSFILKNKEANNYIIAENNISKNEQKEYKIRVWISDDAGDEALNKHYHGKIVVNTVNVNTRKKVK